MSIRPFTLSKELANKNEELSGVESALDRAEKNTFARFFGVIMLLNTIILKLAVTACKYYQTA
jgi:hypothetical protein